MEKFKLGTTYEHLKSGQRYHILTYVRTLTHGCVLLAETQDALLAMCIVIAPEYKPEEWKLIPDEEPESTDEGDKL